MKRKIIITLLILAVAACLFGCSKQTAIQSTSMTKKFPAPCRKDASFSPNGGVIVPTLILTDWDKCVQADGIERQGYIDPTYAYIHFADIKGIQDVYILPNVHIFESAEQLYKDLDKVPKGCAVRVTRSKDGWKAEIPSIECGCVELAADDPVPTGLTKANTFKYGSYTKEN